MTFAVWVEFEVRADAVEAFTAAVCENAGTSLRSESGCVRFDVLSATANKRLVGLYELYVDERAFEKHLETSHYKAFARRTETMVEAKRVRAFVLRNATEPVERGE